MDLVTNWAQAVGFGGLQACRYQAVNKDKDRYRKFFATRHHLVPSFACLPCLIHVVIHVPSSPVVLSSFALEKRDLTLSPLVPLSLSLSALKRSTTPPAKTDLKKIKKLKIKN